jgi:hypothetical protein
MRAVCHNLNSRKATKLLGDCEIRDQGVRAESSRQVPFVKQTLEDNLTRR